MGLADLNLNNILVDLDNAPGHHVTQYGLSCTEGYAVFVLISSLADKSCLLSEIFVYLMDAVYYAT